MNKIAHYIILILMSTTALNAQNKLYDLQLSNLEYAYPSRSIKLYQQGQDLEMSYIYERPENFNGKFLLLLHGKNFSGAYWRTTIAALTKNGYGVIAPDQIGFGKSSKPLHYQYTFQQLAFNTLAVLDSLGIDQVSVLGHSMGGMLATRFTLMFPERVKKFILANPIGLEDWKLKVPYKPIDYWYQYELKATAQSLKEYQRESYYDGKWKPEYDEWVDPLAGWTLNSQYPIIAYNNALTFDMIFTQPVLYEFPLIEHSTLLIIGTRDRTALGKLLVSPEVASTMGRYDILGRQTQNAIPGSKLVELPGVGHMPHIEAFAEFIKPLLEFLGEE